MTGAGAGAQNHAIMPVIASSPQLIAEAGKLLRAGGLVAFPTETVYGLGADATNDKAVAAIFALKGRPNFNPLIIHVADLAQAEALGQFDRRASYLAKRLWPGALTLVLKRRPEARIASQALAGLDTIAIRVPDHPIALGLIAAAGRPLAAPSANRFGALSPTTAQDVEAAFGDAVALVLDGGACRIGLESTVVDLSGANPRILRPGGVTPETVAASLGQIPIAPENSAIKGPGMTASHYAPRLPVRLDCENPVETEGLLAFGAEVPEGFGYVLNLSERGDLAEAATNLYGGLRALDMLPDLTGIATMTIPAKGLGVAINDRLRRAAAPRPR